MAAMNINEKQFEELRYGEKPVRVDFWAPWCGYCRRIPAPGAGGDNSEDAEAQKAIKLAQEIGRTRATANKSVRSEIAGYMR